MSDDKIQLLGAIVFNYAYDIEIDALYLYLKLASGEYVKVTVVATERVDNG